MGTIAITDASENDFPAIQKIYAPYVENTVVSLEDVAPDVKEMTQRWQDLRDKSLPYIVAKAGDDVAGYAYACPYRTRAGYRFTLEESVYVANAHKGSGVGRALLEELILRCRDKGYKQLVAVIAGSSDNESIRFHRKLGFTHAGTLKNIGFKFGAWVDTDIMQKAI